MSRNSRRKREKPSGDSYVDLFIPPQQPPATPLDADRRTQTPAPYTASGVSLDDFIAQQAGER